MSAYCASDEIPIPRMAFLMSVLTRLSASGSHLHAMSFKKENRYDAVPVSLFTMLVGEKGGGKDTVDKAVRAWLMEEDGRLHPDRDGDTPSSGQAIGSLYFPDGKQHDHKEGQKGRKRNNDQEDGANASTMR